MTVLLNGLPMTSCLLPAHHLEGCQVQTVEAHGRTNLHPVQRAFMACDALQCGFCTPGFINEGIAFQGRPSLMQAHISTNSMAPEQLDRYVRHVRTAILPETRQQPGYKGLLILSDPQTGRTIGIGLWETAADRQEVDDSGLTEAQVGKSGPLLNEPIVVEHWEVNIADGFLEANPS